MDRYTAAAIAARLISAGHTHDEVLHELREQGGSKIDCVAALKDAEHMTLVEAKRIVHFSPVWADVKQRDEAIWEEIADDLT